MLFSSYEFIFLFLPVVLSVFLLLTRTLDRGKWQRRTVLGWLLLASLFFYGWWNPAYLPVLLSSVLINFGLSQWMAALPDGGQRKAVLTLGIVGNVSLLIWYKYIGFLIHDVLGLQVDFDRPELPLAISFFTFQQIDYLVDSYRRYVKERSLLTYASFVTLFPHLIAGPIVLYKDVARQLKAQPCLPALATASPGVFIFIIGLFKKVVLADNIAPYASSVFDKADAGQALGTVEAWCGAIAYTFQLYFDFSGYSDMAIGMALLFGITLPQNFNSPYRATSIVEFWRRWHITLSRFLREYIYIPLGGNRKGEARRYANLLTTMAIGGLWHGAGWNFLLWGVLHGVALALNHMWQAATSYRMPRPVGWAGTFLIVVIGWVLFRAETLDGAMSMFTAMAGISGGDAVPDKDIWAWFTAAFVIIFFMPNTLQISTAQSYVLDRLPRLAPYWLKLRDPVLAALSAIMLVIAISQIGGYNEFLYFRF
jgi:alginate O-acetyltransferase complex protein AlgI